MTTLYVPKSVAVKQQADNRRADIAAACQTLMASTNRFTGDNKLQQALIQALSDSMLGERVSYEVKT